MRRINTFFFFLTQTFAHEARKNDSLYNREIECKNNHCALYMYVSDKHDSIKNTLYTWREPDLTGQFLEPLVFVYTTEKNLILKRHRLKLVTKV